MQQVKDLVCAPNKPRRKSGFLRRFTTSSSSSAQNPAAADDHDDEDRNERRALVRQRMEKRFAAQREHAHPEGDAVRTLTQASPSIDTEARAAERQRDERRSSLRDSSRYSAASLREASAHVLEDALLPSERVEEAAQQSDDDEDDDKDGVDGSPVSFEDEAMRAETLLTWLAERGTPAQIVGCVCSFLSPSETVRMAMLSRGWLRATHGLPLRLDGAKKVTEYRLLERVFEPYARGQRRTPWRLAGLYTNIGDLNTLLRVVNAADLRFIGLVNPRVESLAPLRLCTGLQTFELHGCDKEVDFSPLLDLRDSLEAVSLLACKQVVTLSFAGELPLLRRLSAFKSAKVCALPDLHRTPRLELLSLGECRDVSGLAAVSALRQLTTLDLSFVKCVRTLDFLRHASRLKVLILDSCMNLRSLEGLEAAGDALRVLRVNNMMHLRDIAPVAGCSKLTSLEMAALVTVESLEPLQHLEKLADLLLTNCQRVRSLAPLRRSTGTLRRLVLTGCRGLRDTAADAQVVDDCSALAVFACVRVAPAFLVALMGSSRACVVAAAEAQLAAVGRDAFADAVLPEALARWKSSGDAQGGGGLGALRVLQVCAGSEAALDVMAGRGVVDEVLDALASKHPAADAEALCTLGALVRHKAAARAVLRRPDALAFLGAALSLNETELALACDARWSLATSQQRRRSWRRSTASSRGSLNLSREAWHRAVAAERRAGEAARVLARALAQSPAGSEERQAAAFATVAHGDVLRRAAATAALPGIMDRTRQPLLLLLRAVLEGAPESAGAVESAVFAPALLQAMLDSSVETRVLGAALLAAISRSGAAGARRGVAQALLESQAALEMLVDIIGSANLDLAASGAAVVAGVPADLRLRLAQTEGLAAALLNGLREGSRAQRADAVAPAHGAAAAVAGCALAVAALAQSRQVVCEALVLDELEDASAKKLGGAAQSSEAFADALVGALETCALDARIACARACLSLAAHSPAFRAALALAIAQPAAATHLSRFAAAAAAAATESSGRETPAQAAAARDPAAALDFLVLFLEISPKTAPLVGVPAADAAELCAALARGVRSGSAPPSAAARVAAHLLAPRSGHGDLARDTLLAPVAAALDRRSSHLRRLLASVLAGHSAGGGRRTSLPHLRRGVRGADAEAALRRASGGAVAVTALSAREAAKDATRARAATFLAAALRECADHGAEAFAAASRALTAPDTRLPSVVALLVDGSPHAAAAAADLLLACAEQREGASLALSSAVDRAVDGCPALVVEALARVARSCSSDALPELSPLPVLLLLRELCTRLDAVRAAALGRFNAPLPSAAQSPAQNPLMRVLQRALRHEAPVAMPPSPAQAARRSAAASDATDATELERTRSLSSHSRRSGKRGQPQFTEDDEDLWLRCDESEADGLSEHAVVAPAFAVPPPSAAFARKKRGSRFAPGPAQPRHSSVVLRAVARVLLRAAASELGEECAAAEGDAGKTLAAGCAVLDELAHADADAVRFAALRPLLRALPASQGHRHWDSDSAFAGDDQDENGDDEDEDDDATQPGSRRSRRLSEARSIASSCASIVQTPDALSALLVLETAAEMRGSALREALLDAGAPAVLAARLRGPLSRANEVPLLLRALRALLSTPAASAASELADLCSTQPGLAAALLCAAADPTAARHAREALSPLLSLAGDVGVAGVPVADDNNGLVGAEALRQALAVPELGDALDAWRHWLSECASEKKPVSLEDVELCTLLIRLAQNGSTVDAVGALEDALVSLLLQERKSLELRRAYARAVLALSPSLAVDGSPAYRRSALAADTLLEDARQAERKHRAAQLKRFPAALTRVRGLPGAFVVSAKDSAALHSVTLDDWACVATVARDRHLSASARTRRLYFELELCGMASEDLVVGWAQSGSASFAQGELRGALARGVGDCGSCGIAVPSGVAQEGDVLGVALDMQARRVTLSVNGETQEQRTLDDGVDQDELVLMLPALSASKLDAFINLGARPFRFSAPGRGFRSVCKALRPPKP